MRQLYGHNLHRLKEYGKIKKSEDSEECMRAYLFRIRFVASIIAVTVLPIVVTGIVLLNIAERALLEEKQAKLIAITQQLDYALPNDFATLLRQQNGLKQNRQQQIALLHKSLLPVTDKIANANPGIGVGYYAAELDAILTYGPSAEMGQYVGKPIDSSHPGREVMRTGIMKVAIGEQVRGNIMNAMYPLIRDGKVIGYAWANELMSNIDVQLAGMRQGIYAILAIGCLVAAAASGLLVHRLEVIITEIKTGLRQLSGNLSFRMKRMAGEPGEIIEAVNKLAEDLQASQTHTENIIQSMDSGVIALNPQSVVTVWNHAAERITGINAEKAVGKSLPELPGIEKGISLLLQDTLTNGKTCRDIEIACKVNERASVIKITTSILRNPLGVTLGAIAVMEDLTAYKVMEHKLAQAKRLAVLGELAASIAHEVRNPLTSIKAFTQIIEEELPQNHDSREYTAIIVEEVERLNRFADELLLFSRPTVERHLPVRIQEVLEHTLLLVEHSAVKQGIFIIKKEKGSIPQVEASPELLKQVFLNILLNAIQATPAGGRIELEVEAVAGQVLIHCANDGSSIEEAHLLSIFEPFFTTKKSGTGLGLSISQRIVQAYGGHISVKNINTGVRFTVALPAKREEDSE